MDSNYYDRLIRSSNQILERWDGTRVRVWSLTQSHRTLIIALGDVSTKDNLAVYCIEPLRMTGAFDWDSSQLRVSLDSSPGAAPVIRLADEKSEFEVRCSSLEMKKNISL